MATWWDRARACDRAARRLGAVAVLAGTLAAFAGITIALAATLPGRPSGQLRRVLESGYRFWASLSDRCVPLTLGCLAAGWLLAWWDRAAGDGSRASSHRLIRRLNVASLVLAFFVPHYAALY